MFLSLLWLAFFLGGRGSLTEMLKVWQQQLGDEDMGESRRNGEQQRLVGWYLMLWAVVDDWLKNYPVIARGSEQSVARDSMYFRFLNEEPFYITHSSSGWWQLKYLLFSPLFGEDEPILTHIFQMVWNHQLVILRITGVENVDQWCLINVDIGASWWFTVYLKLNSEFSPEKC